MHGTTDIRELAERSETLIATRAALGEAAGSAWFVGGSVRDLLAGRAVADVDLAVDGDARRVARALHDRLGGDIFTLSDRFGTCRVLPGGGAWQIDVTALRGDDIEQDLAKRDFTVNAMALRADGGAALTDPFGGADDVAARVLRVLGESAYTDDPLRPLRLPRLAVVLGFAPDAETARLTTAHAAAVASASPERIFAELRALVAADEAPRGVALLDELGLMQEVLPELARLKGVEQTVYHHLDAFGHTLEVFERTIEIEADPEPVFGALAPRLRALFDEPLADELTRGGALRWAALLHDIAKSETRVEFDDGRVGFPGHDRRGAEIARSICRRLHTSDRFGEYVGALTRHHMRLGFLVREQPLAPRDVYRYLRACEPVEVEVGIFTVADRLATRGRKADEAIAAHLELARELTAAALDWRANPPRRLVRGDELAAALGVDTGPVIGRALDAIAEEQYAGTVNDAAAAIDFARRRLAEDGFGDDA